MSPADSLSCSILFALEDLWIKKMIICPTQYLKMAEGAITLLIAGIIIPNFS